MLDNQPVNDKISSFNVAPLYGLILAGGASTRMGKDKAVLSYHATSQIEYGFKLLSHLCEKVYLSNRQEQATQEGYKDYPQIHDIFKDIGPMGGILSALCTCPAAAWLVLGCDLPFVDEATLRRLCQNRDPLKRATAYLNRDENFPEPLCTIYEPNSRGHLLRLYDLRLYSLRDFLASVDVQRVKPESNNDLRNVNTKEEYQQAVEFRQQKNFK